MVSLPALLLHDLKFRRQANFGGKKLFLVCFRKIRFNDELDLGVSNGSDRNHFFAVHFVD